MGAALIDGGYTLTDRPEEASVIPRQHLRLHPAARESIEEILRMAHGKARGKDPAPVWS
jgi:hypothetical protein